VTVEELIASSRTIIVAGKGGVGKTTVSAALACAAARRGLRVLFIELDGKPIPVELTSGEGHITTMSLTAGDALVDYLEHHGLGRLAKRFASTGILDVVAAAAPGLDDLLVLGRIKALERASDHDLIVVDGPAAGHALTFLRVAHGIRGGIRSGLIATQAAEVGEFLADHTRCSVVMVTLPATTPVTETIDTALAIEDEIGVALGPIVVNRLLPAIDLASEVCSSNVLARSAQFYQSRRTLQEESIDILQNLLPLPRITLPDVTSPSVIASVTDALLDDGAMT
jgi:arsenite-transporting ATPase